MNGLIEIQIENIYRDVYAIPRCIQNTTSGCVAYLKVAIVYYSLLMFMITFLLYSVYKCYKCCMFTRIEYIKFINTSSNSITNEYTIK